MFTTLISTAELADLQQRLPAGQLAIVDCRFSLTDTERGRRDYVKSHIPGAIYAHLDEDLSGPVRPGLTGRHPLPDPDDFARRLGSWGIGPGVQVVAYDDADAAIAARLWWMLRWLGHEAVACLEGGWRAWVAEARPARSGPEQRQPTTFLPDLRSDRVVTAAEVEALRQHPNWRLLDARGADRYRGQNETIDPVAGHIPGALSAPYAANLDASQRFRPAQDLAQHYASLLGDTPAGRVVCYCGSGVTAAHNLLAMLHAGLGEGRLYAGSWSEWIADPDRPVARGQA